MRDKMVAGTEALVETLALKKQHSGGLARTRVIIVAGLLKFDSWHVLYQNAAGHLCPAGSAAPAVPAPENTHELFS